MSNRPEAPQNRDTHPLFGMQEFRWWWHELAEKISPTDIDGHLHSDHGVAGRHLFLEFKAAKESMRGRESDGQLKGLINLSKLPRAQVLVIFDPFHDVVCEERMDMSTPVRAQLIREGRLMTERWTTLDAIKKNTWDWVWNKGPFAEPVIDYAARIAELIEQGASGEDIRRAAGLPPMTVTR